MTFGVILTPEAENDLQQIHDYIVSKSFPQNAASYAGRLIDRLETIATAPYQGMSREDIGPGFRTTGFERRITILYVIRAQRSSSQASTMLASSSLRPSIFSRRLCAGCHSPNGHTRCTVLCSTHPRSRSVIHPR